MSVRDRHIQKVDDDYEHEKHADVEDDNVDVPLKPL